jgi:hypothetical protein
MSHLGEKVSSLVDGQLSVDAAERAHMHIAGCVDCRQAVEFERLMKQRLSVLGAPTLGEDLVSRLIHLAGPSGPLPPRPGHVPGSPRPQLADAGFRSGGQRGGGVLMSSGANLVGAGASLVGSGTSLVATGASLVGPGSSRVLRTHPLGRRPSSRPPAAPRPGLGPVVQVSRASRNRMAAAMVGAACLVGAGVAGGVANGTGGVADQRVVPAIDTYLIQHAATTTTLPFADQTVVWKPVGAGR